MTVKITCPVCDKPGIESDTCPNCETDLSSIRMLMELPPAVTKSGRLPPWLSGVGLLLLLGGLALGVALTSALNPKPLPIAAPNPIETPPSPVQTVIKKSKPCAAGFYYRVRNGDSLSLIGERFYGGVKDYNAIVRANPGLKNRINNLEIGETILIPNSGEYYCE